MTDLTPGTFDVLAVIKGRKYPEQSTDIYFDSEAMFELDVLEQRIADETDGDVVNSLDAEGEAIKERIRASKLTFEMRGLSHGHVTALLKKVAADYKEAEGIDLALEQTYAHISASIVKVTNAAGEEGATDWNRDAVEALYNYLPPTEFGKLTTLANDLSFKTLKFEEKATSPDF